MAGILNSLGKKILFHSCFFFLILGSLELILFIFGNIYLQNFYIRQDSGQRTPQTVTVLCLGESSTAGLGVAPKDSYPAQLEKKLNLAYPQKDIRVLVPPHVGQNTSQVANRIQHYLKVYQPQLVIIMAGYNNEWSLAESHIGKFLPLRGFDNLKVKLLVKLNSSRLFKLSRYLYLKFLKKEKSAHVVGLEATNYVWGGPELTRWPPKKWVYAFAREHRQEFIELWRYDIQQIITSSKENGANVLLMTYPVNPTYLSSHEFLMMSIKEDVPLVANDQDFEKLKRAGVYLNYVLSDLWHPNQRGYEIISENAFQAIVDLQLLSN